MKDEKLRVYKKRLHCCGTSCPEYRNVCYPETGVGFGFCERAGRKIPLASKMGFEFPSWCPLEVE